MAKHDELIAQFVASFEKLDHLTVCSAVYPIAPQLAVGEPDEWGYTWWRPVRVTAEPALLEPFYAKLPARFPPLFEELVLSYRWLEVDLGSFRLLSNPPEANLNGLLQEMSRDPAIWSALLPAGLMQFAKGTDMNYDPVCFDIKSRKKNREFKIVRIDHEEILCNNRVKVVEEVAPTFRDLVLRTIDAAKRT
jgi:hypothetical protein